MKTDEHVEWIRASIEQFEGPLIRYTARITGNTELARDVVQDAFLKLCSANREKVENRLAAWLYTVCRNRALDVARKERRMTPLTETQARTCKSPAPNPSAIAEKADAQNEIESAIHALSENQQEVLRLKFQDSLSYKEISQITGLSESNVGYLLHTAIRNIRGKIAVKFDLSNGKPGGRAQSFAEGEQS